MIDRAQQGLPIEDSRVELKAKWIEKPNHIARRIAGQCNANAGDNVLWLIGVSETDGVVGVDHQDMAKWWPGVVSQFDGQPPIVQDVAITHDGLTVVALLFQTDRVPFVVRNPVYGQQGGGGGPVEREVPWREATSIRSATHADLVRLLVPVSALPTVEVYKAEAKMTPDKDADTASLFVIVTIYAITALGAAMALPNHQAKGHFSVSPHKIDGELTVNLEARYSDLMPKSAMTATVHQGDLQILLDGPGFFRIVGRATIPNLANDWANVGTLEVKFSVRPAGNNLSLEVQTGLSPYLVPAEEAKPRPATYGWCRHPTVI